jgi:helicase
VTPKAVFIGVNQHVDPKIPELGGACRDATALWALFTDTFPGMTGRLLTDWNASHATVKHAVLDLLSSAGSEDVVVISFAGHGSPDGRLVLYDTSVTALAETTLSMSDLAQAFRSTKARAVLCILDCCFSGHAPARVLEIGARPRNAFALAEVQGEGRIILSACAATESAWEQPGTGHGILTYAVIHALSDAATDRVSFPEVGGEIIRLARLEAERIAVTQTPEFLGSIQGGLVFPTLKRGENYLASFPPDPDDSIKRAVQGIAGGGISRGDRGGVGSTFSRQV